MQLRIQLYEIRFLRDLTVSEHVRKRKIFITRLRNFLRAYLSNNTSNENQTCPRKSTSSCVLIMRRGTARAEKIYLILISLRFHAFRPKTSYISTCHLSLPINFQSERHRPQTSLLNRTGWSEWLPQVHVHGIRFSLYASLIFICMSVNTGYWSQSF